MRATLLFFLLFCTASSFKILIYSPRFGRSHVTFLGGIADVLVQEGMDVTIVMPTMNPFVHTNGTKLVTKVIHIDQDPRVMSFYNDPHTKEGIWTLDSVNPLADKYLMDRVREAHVHQCEKTLKQRELIEQLRNEKFDLGISAVFDLCGLGLFDEIGLKSTVLANSGAAMLFEKIADIFGAPNVPAVLPGGFSDVSNEMTYSQRIVNLVKVYFAKWWVESVRDAEQEVMEKVLGRKVDIDQKIAEASFMLINSHPLLDFPRPLTERIVSIGGISVPKAKPLDEYWEGVVSARKATVLLSFGSVAQSAVMPDEMKKAILNTFSRFPDVTFIWKYEVDEHEVAKDVPNVITNKWVPQNDLLAHRNVKAFITHAGMNSILESSHLGVPVLCIPLFADQLRNAQMVKRLGSARSIDKKQLYDPDVLEANIRELLEDQSYRSNATRLSKMMAKRPRDQRDQLVKHIKFAAEFGSLPEYRIPQLPFVQYYMLDIFIPLFVIAITMALGLLYGITTVIRKVLAVNAPKQKRS
ncbi:hypothetical protein QR680_016081 [Steinernema hermaphroditum]|uniref:glucuronosyltransferase n=1 Tax=Steinernema hermaphroditum TaxID=289476 RepID=A0AA39H9Z8_9BILA|nr:hypothetical protein QR680_016081 [Steinernema hermaphroditum]